MLVQNLASNDFEFECKIPFANPKSESFPLIQIKRVTNLETINSYGENLLNSLVNRHCFELIGVCMFPSLTNNNLANSMQVNRVLVSCATQFDLKMWLDTVQTALNSLKPPPNGKSSTSNLATRANGSVLSKQDSNLSLNKPLNTSTGKLNSSACSNGNGVHGNSTSVQRGCTVKTYSFRPHPPLIPHFQLPNDLPQNTSLDGTSTLKRFMYKKPKLTEPFGKCRFYSMLNCLLETN
jgi:hypothetical protein